MRPLVLHHLRANLADVVSRSLTHCHLRNVHSLALTAGVRMFVAEPGNALWANHPSVLRERQSLALHPHRNDLTLVPFTYNVWNVTARRVPGSDFGEYAYQSPILRSKGGFSPIGRASVADLRADRLRPEHGAYMPAAALHTVFVPSDEWAAWLVLEGREDPGYSGCVLSVQELDKQDLSSLYQPMALRELRRLVSCVLTHGDFDEATGGTVR